MHVKHSWVRENIPLNPSCRPPPPFSFHSPQPPSTLPPSPRAAALTLISEKSLDSPPGSRGPLDRGRWWLDLDCVAHLCFAPSLRLHLRLHSILITLCGIYGCLLLVDLARTHFISFCCSPEAWGGSLFRFSPPFVKTRFVSSNRWRDLQWSWMFSWQWIWGLLSLQAFLDYPLGDFRVDLAKLFLVESSNRIAWHLIPWTIRFTSFVTVCSDGSLAPSLLSPRTSPVVAALPCCWIVIKSCSVCCICFCIFTFLLLCLVFFYVVACVVLLVGSCIMTYVIFAALVIEFGFCCVIDLVSFQTKLEVFQDYDFQ